MAFWATGSVNRVLLAAVAVLGLGVARLAAAAPVTFAYEGLLTSDVWVTDSPDGTVGAFFNAGDTISGEFTFESTSPEGPPGLFVGAISAASFSVNSGIYTGGSSNGDIDWLANFFVVTVRDSDGLSGAALGANPLTFFDVQVSSTTIPGGPLPTSPLPVTPADNFGANWDRVELIYTTPDAGIAGAAFQLQSLTAVVPEPSTALLLAVAAAGALLISGRTTPARRNRI